MDRGSGIWCSRSQTTSPALGCHFDCPCTLALASRNRLAFRQLFADDRWASFIELSVELVEMSSTVEYPPDQQP